MIETNLGSRPLCFMFEGRQRSLLPVYRLLLLISALSSTLSCSSLVISALPRQLRSIFPRFLGKKSNSRITSSALQTAMSDGNMAFDEADTATIDKDTHDFHLYCSVAVDLSNAHAANGLLTVQRSVRDIDEACRQTYLYQIPLVEKEGKQLQLPPSHLNKNVSIRIPSPSGSNIAVFKQNQNTKGSVSYILEVWTQGGACLERRIDLSFPKQQHGKIMNDPAGFGVPVWNEHETMLIYNAERSSPAVASFFELDQSALSANSAKDATVPQKKRGGQFEVGVGTVENWGEKLSEQSALLDLFVVHVQSGKVARVSNVPGTYSESRNDGGITLGQASFSPDGMHVVYTGWDAGELGTMPRRLGFIFCRNRASKVYSSSISKLVGSLEKNSIDSVVDDEYKLISPQNHRLSRSPRFIDDKETGLSVIFLSNKDGFISHDGCMGLHAVNFNEASSGTSREFIPVVSLPSSDVCSASVEGLNFPGLFLGQLPARCQIPGTQYIVTSTLWGSVQRLIRIDVRTGSIALIDPSFADKSTSASNSFLCLSHEGDLLFSEGGSDQPPRILQIGVEELTKEAPENHILSCDAVMQRKFAPIAATAFSPLKLSADAPFPPLFFEIVTFNPPSVDGAVDAPIQSILIYPKRAAEDTTKLPLIVIPHGGPHSCSAVGYSPGMAYLAGAGGYALLLTNYRGSVGFGQATLESLMSRVGELDVSDVMSAAKHTANNYNFIDENNIGICGGSHGGFLTGHCTGQYPDFFKAAVVRNPVMNIASMVTATDIPDWCYAETFGAYDFSAFRAPKLDELTTMWKKSPIAHVDNVQTPTLVALGMVDLRVPPSQGVEWYHTLRSKGVDTKLLMYPEDSHALDKVTTEADHWINIKRWFDKYLK